MGNENLKRCSLWLKTIVHSIQGFTSGWVSLYTDDVNSRGLQTQAKALSQSYREQHPGSIWKGRCHYYKTIFSTYTAKATGYKLRYTRGTWGISIMPFMITNSGQCRLCQKCLRNNFLKSLQRLQVSSATIMCLNYWN